MNSVQNFDLINYQKNYQQNGQVNFRQANLRQFQQTAPIVLSLSLGSAYVTERNLTKKKAENYYIFSEDNSLKTKLKRIFRPTAAKKDYSNELTKQLETNGIYIRQNSHTGEIMKFSKDYDFNLSEYNPFNRLQPPINRTFYTNTEKEAILLSLRDDYAGDLKTKDLIEEHKKITQVFKRLQENYGVKDISYSNPGQGQPYPELNVVKQNGNSYIIEIKQEDLKTVLGLLKKVEQHEINNSKK